MDSALRAAIEDEFRLQRSRPLQDCGDPDPNGPWRQLS
jgi:hypothetical protein